MRLARMIQTVDAHACSEPGRVIVGGVLDVPGRTMYDKMQHLQNHADGLRKLMLREPRGNPRGKLQPDSPTDARRCRGGIRDDGCCRKTRRSVRIAPWSRQSAVGRGSPASAITF
jgi:hypothetical protein